MSKLIKFHIIDEEVSNLEAIEDAISSFNCSQKFLEGVSMCQLKSKEVIVCVIYTSKHDRI